MVGLNQYMDSILGLEEVLEEHIRKFPVASEFVETFRLQFLARCAYKQRRTQKTRTMSEKDGILGESLLYACIGYINFGIEKVIVNECGWTQIGWSNGSVETPAPKTYDTHDFEWFCDIIEKCLEVILPMLKCDEESKIVFEKNFKMFLLKDYIASNGRERLNFLAISDARKNLGFWAALHTAQIAPSSISIRRIDIIPDQRCVKVKME